MTQLTEEQKKNVKEADNKTLLRWLFSLGWDRVDIFDPKWECVEDEILKRMENHG